MSTRLRDSLLGRGVILVVARVTNQGILVISPIILTRLLEVEAYGLYREFILYAMVFVGLCQFAIDRSLLYFIPKYPDRRGVFVTQCVMFMAMTYMLGVGIYAIALSLVPSLHAFDHSIALLLYVFLVMSLDVLGPYWLGIKDSVKVLVFGAIRMVCRVAAVVVAAYVAGTVEAIILALIVVEAARWLLVLGYLRWYGLVFRWGSTETLREHLRFVVPLGSASVVQHANRYLGQVFTVAVLGPVALAAYVLGAYLQMVSHITRSSVSDVIFPDMVEREAGGRNRSLALWQSSSVVYAAVLIPTGVFCFLNAEAVVVLLFSNAYLLATPVFMVFSLVLIRDCINFGVPLRALNRTGVVFQSTLVGLAVTAALTLPLIREYGVVGPAIALLIGKVAEELFMGVRLIRITCVPLHSLLPWRTLGAVALTALVAVGVMQMLASPVQPDILRLMLVAGGSAALYLGALYLQRIPELEYLLAKVTAVLRRWSPGAAT